jgi:hypothetical protein
MAKQPQSMTDSELRRAYASAQNQKSKVNERMIRAGRGEETYEQTMRASDPLAKQYQKHSNRIGDIQNVAQRRWGPDWRHML